MCWSKRDVWRLGIPLVGLLLLLVFMVWIPMSAADAHAGTSEFATPTVDLTVTALAKEQLTLQVKQLQNQLQNQNSWIENNSTALIAAITAIIVASIGLYQWRGNQNAERRKEIGAQDKDLTAQAEERFKTAVTALGSENEATQVSGAILLRSFLNPEDKGIYGRYYAQIFDLAVAYLRLSSTSRPIENPSLPLPLTSLRQALIIVFKEVFPLARNSLGQIQSAIEGRSLDASGIRLDGAFLAWSDLSHIWMINASLIEARLLRANLCNADLRRANLHKANLHQVIFAAANLHQVNFSQAHLGEANLNEADLDRADLTEANLEGATLISASLQGTKFSGANLRRADLSHANLSAGTSMGETFRSANPEDALHLDYTDLRGVKGLTREQLKACKAKGAIIDEDAVANPPQSLVPPPPPSQQSS